MTRSELTTQLAAKNGLSSSTAEKVVNELFASISQTLSTGGRVEIRGFGSFEVRDYEGYVARNPKTGEKISVKSKKNPFFKTGKELKGRVDKGARS